MWYVVKVHHQFVGVAMLCLVIVDVGGYCSDIVGVVVIMFDGV